jgi:bifunctional DNase/RNase
MIQVSVGGMILDENTRGPVLLLHVPPLDRYLPIWIGPSEAASIGLALQKERFERPLTHDLLVMVIDGLEGEVSRVVVTDQREGTYYAKIFIERDRQVIGIDARPSDAIAVAVRTATPIYVTEEVLAKVDDSLLALDEEATRAMREHFRRRQEPRHPPDETDDEAGADDHDTPGPAGTENE